RVTSYTATVTNGNLASESTASNADVYVYSASGSTAAIILGITPSTPVNKWFMENNATNQLAIVDAVNSNTAWLKVTTGGNATVGENATNLLSVDGGITSIGGSPTLTKDRAQVPP